LRLITQVPGHVKELTFAGNALGPVATVSQYLLAPLTMAQLNVGLVETPLDPSRGLRAVGAGRFPPSEIVVNDSVAENCPWRIGATESL
jgi:hypothetical protein